MSYPMPEFRDADHTYWLEHREVPSVTTIIQRAGLINTTWFRDHHRGRGHAVHRAAELVDQARLDPGSVDDQIRGYLDAYEQFLVDHCPEWIEIERVVYSRDYGYTGTLDRVGRLHIHGTRSELPALVDLKTGSRQPTVSLQLAAYAQAYREETDQLCSRYALYLQPTGRYRLEPFEAAGFMGDLTVFLSALNVLRWKERNGVR